MKLKRKPCTGCSMRCYKNNCSEVYKVPLKHTTSRKSPLSQTNEERVLSDKAMTLGDSPYYNLLVVVAQAFDAIASGQDVYLIIGATQSKASFVFTIKDAGVPTSYYGTALSDLGYTLEDAL